MSLNERELLIALHHMPGIGPQRWQNIQAHLESPLALLDFSESQLYRVLGAKAAELFVGWRAKRPNNWLQHRLDALGAWLSQEGNALVVQGDDAYPNYLHELDGPLLLHVAGDPTLLSLPQIAVVGARKATHAGCRSAHQFSKVLAAGGYAITSGLALGIDTAAHRGALEANGKTVAVLGSGLDTIYPARNQALAAQIIEQGGALVSEFALGVKPEPGHFPRRNRIISGLSMATLVVEAAMKSGSLITARQALEQNREVFAIPGSIYSDVSEGCHWLIREGATLVTSPEQLAEQLGCQLAVYEQALAPSLQRLPTAPDLAPELKSLLKQIGQERMGFEQLLLVTSLSVPELHQRLGELEMLGMIQTSELGIEVIT